MRQFMFGFVVYLLCGVLPNFGESRKTSDSACYFGTHAGTQGSTIVNTFPRVNCGVSGISQNKCEAKGCCFDDTRPNTYHCFFKNNHPSKKNSERVCDNGAPSMRSDCGWPGISQKVCKSRGCCWDNSIIGKKFCFYKSKLKPKLQQSCKNIDPFKRSDCGYPGIPEADCKKKGCCWDDSIPNVKWCFNKSKKVPAKHHKIDLLLTSCNNAFAFIRIDCGYPGIPKAVCKKRGCCWDDSVPNVKWCFYKFKKAPSTNNKKFDVFVPKCNNGLPFQRNDCGYPGISKADCKKRGCCWDDSVPNTKWCFQKFKKETLVSFSEKDCEAFGLLKGCNNVNIGALGEIQKSDAHLASTFAGRTDVFAHEGGVGASANAHLADISQKLGPFNFGANVGKVGVEGYATIDRGVGVGVKATLAEAGGGVGLKTPGLRWVGVGGKVGLSANTGVKIGPETEVKILGTGVSVSPSKGLELCFIGSCVWIG